MTGILITRSKWARSTFLICGRWQQIRPRAERCSAAKKLLETIEDSA